MTPEEINNARTNFNSLGSLLHDVRTSLEAEANIQLLQDVLNHPKAVANEGVGTEQVLDHIFGALAKGGEKLEIPGSGAIFGFLGAIAKALLDKKPPPKNPVLKFALYLAEISDDLKALHDRINTFAKDPMLFHGDPGLNHLGLLGGFGEPNVVPTNIGARQADYSLVYRGVMESLVRASWQWTLRKLFFVDYTGEEKGKGELYKYCSANLPQAKDAPSGMTIFSANIEEAFQKIMGIWPWFYLKIRPSGSGVVLGPTGPSRGCKRNRS
jgi:hypothetical protein